MEKILPCSRTGMTSQKTEKKKTWGPDTVYALVMNRELA
jgi:hypothetical protein